MLIGLFSFLLLNYSLNFYNSVFLQDGINRVFFLSHICNETSVLSY